MGIWNSESVRKLINKDAPPATNMMPTVAWIVQPNKSL